MLNLLKPTPPCLFITSVITLAASCGPSPQTSLHHHQTHRPIYSWQNHAWSDYGNHDQKNLKKTGHDYPEYTLVDPSPPNDPRRAFAKAKHTAAICYMSVGTYEIYRNGPGTPASPLKKAMTELSYLCTSPYSGTNSHQEKSCQHADPKDFPSILKIMKVWVDHLVQLGQCEGIELDNIDLMPLDFKLKMADYVRDQGLKVGLKNDYIHIEDTRDHFDFWIMESCAREKIWGSDDRLCAYAQEFEVSKPIFGVEYAGKKAKICQHEARQGISMHLEQDGQYKTCF